VGTGAPLGEMGVTVLLAGGGVVVVARDTPASGGLLVGAGALGANTAVLTGAGARDGDVAGGEVVEGAGEGGRMVVGLDGAPVEGKVFAGTAGGGAEGVGVSDRTPAVVGGTAVRDGGAGALTGGRVAAGTAVDGIGVLPSCATAIPARPRARASAATARRMRMRLLIGRLLSTGLFARVVRGKTPEGELAREYTDDSRKVKGRISGANCSLDNQSSAFAAGGFSAFSAKELADTIDSRWNVV